MENSQLLQLEPATNWTIFRDKPEVNLFSESKDPLGVAGENLRPIQVPLGKKDVEEFTANGGDHGAVAGCQNDTEQLDSTRNIVVPGESCSPEDKVNEEDKMIEDNGGSELKEEDEDIEVLPFRTLRLSLPKVPSRPQTMLGPAFPLELRQKIYTYLFTPPPSTPTRWSLRHSATCPLRSRTNASEAPPFVTESPIRMDEVQRWKLTHPVPRPESCRCAKRHRGLNLLLTNRQIYNEAAPYFYSLTEFCFDDGFELMGFCKVIPACWKDMIKIIGIVGPDYDASAAHHSWSRQPPRERTIEVVWDAILTFSSLKILKLTQCHVQYSSRRIKTLRKERAVKIFVVEIRKVWYFYRDERLENIWMGYEEPFEDRFDKRLKSIWDSSSFWWVAARGSDGVKDRLERAVREGEDITTELSPMTIELIPLVVTNPQDSYDTEIFTLWGLPNTKAQRILLMHEESADRAERKRLGLPSRKEEETRIKIEKARRAKKAKREEKLAEEEAESKRLRVFKKKEQTFYQKEEMRERERIVENKRKEVLGRAKSAEIYRKRERKAAFKRDVIVVCPRKKV